MCVLKLDIFKYVFTQSQISDVEASHIVLASQSLHGGKKAKCSFLWTEGNSVNAHAAFY